MAIACILVASFAITLRPCTSLTHLAVESASLAILQAFLAATGIAAGREAAYTPLAARITGARISPSP